jgi:hypothetical protein
VGESLGDTDAEHCGGGSGAGEHNLELALITDAGEYLEVAVEELGGGAASNLPDTHGFLT